MGVVLVSARKANQKPDSSPETTASTSMARSAQARTGREAHRRARQGVLVLGAALIFGKPMPCLDGQALDEPYVNGRDLCKFCGKAQNPPNMHLS